MRDIKTERLILRRETMDDCEMIFKEFHNRPEITRYTNWDPYTSMESTIAKIARDVEGYETGDFYGWIIEFNGEFAGTIGAYNVEREIKSIELGYTINPKYWNLGIGKEAAKAAVDYLMDEKGFNRVHAWTHEDNLPSEKILKATGMKEEGVLREVMLNPDGSLSNQKMFAVISKDRA